MLSDLRFALRQFVKTPSFTLVALVTLALGIGSATVVFSGVNALLLRPLPYVGHAEDRVLFVTQTDLAAGRKDLGLTYADYAALRSRSTTLAGLWIHSDLTVIVAGKPAPRRVLGTEISWDAFALMQVPPLLGRPFHASDAKPGAAPVALISHELWQGRFGGDPAVIDTSTILNGQPVTIVGIMPRGWRYPDFTDVWTPLRPDESMASMRGYYKFSGRGLLQPGATLEDARIEANTIMAAIAQEHPLTNSGIGIRLRPVREEAAEDTAHLTLLLFFAVLFVFAIACVNVANLLLTRSVSRSKEVAIRLALGAERRRVIRQLICENLVLSLAGGVLGLILALWGKDLMVALIPDMAKPFWLRFDFDVRVFGFVLLLSLASAVLFGLLPAIKASRPDLVGELKEGGRQCDTGGLRATRLRNLLVVAEVALALVLLVGAGLMMRSFLSLRQLDPGFDARDVLTFRTGFPADMTKDDADLPSRFFADLVPRLAGLPGVESVGLVSAVPGNWGEEARILVEGMAEPAHPSQAPSAQFRVASPGYFPTLRIPLRAGRLFDDVVDRRDTPRVALVDDTFAVRHFGSTTEALGKRLRFVPGKYGMDPEWVEIVGVVGSIRHQIDRDEPAPTVYLPVSQESPHFLTAVMRTGPDPVACVDMARQAVLDVNPAIPIYHELTLNNVIMRTVWPRQFFSYLFTMFGLVALLLACIGIYGVMSYNVTQRTQEIGVRMALGAQSAEVVRMVVRRGLELVGWGLGLGVAAAFSLAHLLTGVLYGVSPHDPPTFAVVPALLAAVALVACWLPSRRASRVEPAIAIRAE